MIIVPADQCCPSSGFCTQGHSTAAYRYPLLIEHFDLNLPGRDDSVGLPLYQKVWWSH